MSEHKQEVKYMDIIMGRSKCTVPEFKPAEYKGLRKNCGRPLSKAALDAKLSGLRGSVPQSAAVNP